MQNDVRLQYGQTLDESHYGHPTVVQVVHTGTRGRPSVSIDPDFLRWAHSHRSTSAISRFLGVSRTTVRNALINHGIATTGTSPFVYHGDSEESDSESGGVSAESNRGADLDVIEENSDDILNHTFTFPQTFSSDILEPLSTPSTGPLPDLQLDHLISQLRRHYTRAGITMLDGMLRRLGYRISREAIRQSLLRIDPVQRVFERIRIRRRTYSVPGPNSLWHHDGQHGTFSSHYYYTNYLLIYLSH